MPKPTADESQDQFIDRCIPTLAEEGREQDQAVAICHSLWTEKKSQFMTWKSKSGEHLWLALWSNKYRDRDHPPEILTNAAHLDFVKAVNTGTWPYPELCIWHIPGSAWGDATYIDYDEVNGIAIAGGTVRPGLETVAKALNSAAVRTLVSHGMPRKEIQRDPDDPSIITRFRSAEISPLPDYAAANELTGFLILETGGNMEVQKSLKERLTAFFKGDETKADEIAELLHLTGTEAKEADLECKETEPKVEAKVEEEVKAESVTETPTEEPAPELPEPASRKEVEDVVVRLTELMGDTNTTIKSLAESMQEIANRITALEESDEKKITELAASTPRASLIEIVNSSIIGKEQVKVDGRSTLARDIPKETKVEDYIVRTGHPLMSAAITDIVEHGTGVFSQGGSNG